MDNIINDIENKTKARGLNVTVDNMVKIPEDLCLELFKFIDKKNNN